MLTYLTSVTYGGRGYVDSQRSSVWRQELKAAGRVVPSEAAGRCRLLLALSFLIQSDSVALGMCPLPKFRVGLPLGQTFLETYFQRYTPVGRPPG